MRSLLLVFLSAGMLVGCSSNRYDRYGRAYPASARVDGGNGQDRYVICHKGKNTRTLPASAVEAHLNHGDRFGACRGDRDRRGNRDSRGRRGRGNGRGNGNG